LVAVSVSPDNTSLYSDNNNTLPGAVGIEIAAELKMLRPQSNVTLIHSRQTLLSSEPLPKEFSAKTLELLKESKVELVLGARVQETVLANDSTPAKYILKLSNGEVTRKDTSASHRVLNSLVMSLTRSITMPQVILRAGLVSNVEERLCTRAILLW
jgi:hypothetical protein